MDKNHDNQTQFKERSAHLCKVYKSDDLVPLSRPQMRQFNPQKIKNIFNQLSRKDTENLINLNTCSQSFESTMDCSISDFIKIQEWPQEQVESSDLASQYFIYCSSLLYQNENKIQNIGSIRIKAIEKISSGLIVGLQEILDRRENIQGDFKLYNASNKDKIKLFKLVDLLSFNIENSCYKLYNDLGDPNRKYGQKMNVLLRELKDPKNFQLRSKILNQEIPSTGIFQLDQIQLVPPERRKKMQLIKQNYMNQMTVKPKFQLANEQVSFVSETKLVSGLSVLSSSESLSLFPSRSMQQRSDKLIKELGSMIMSGPNKMRKIIGEQLPEEISSLLLLHLDSCFC